MIHDPYAALRNKNFRRYFIGNAFSLIGQQAATMTIGWELYARTDSQMTLGLVGFVQIVPILLLALPAGHVVDRFNRKTIILLAAVALVVLNILMGFASHFASCFPLASLTGHINEALAWGTHRMGDSTAHFDDPYVPILLFLLMLIGAVRAINQPARQTMMPMLLPPHQFPNAVTWNTSLMETSNVIGPMLAGLALVLLSNGNSKAHPRTTWAFASLYWMNAVCQLIQLINFSLIELSRQARPVERMTRKSLLAGVHFVLGDRVILGVMTLDLFAVLLGGATALLPVFARDILQVGEVGFGCLSAAPSIGAITMAIIVAHRPPMKNAGRNMLIAVAGFGVAMIVFGLSRYFWLSIVALVVTGLCDNISVVVRHSLIQLRTPDHMRGRVNAVNSVFISCSNEIGRTESGTTSAIGTGLLGPILGPMIAVAAGGVGTLGVVAAVNAIWPQVRKVKQLSQEQPVGLTPVEVGAVEGEGGTGR